MSLETIASTLNLPAPPPFISFVLPVYNEQSSLQELHGAITAVMSRQPYAYEFVFVDDGSTDTSFDVLGVLQQQDTKVRVIRFRKNFGKAAAYGAGFRHAKGAMILTMDTDLQDDAQDIPRFIEKLSEGYDMVVGWRHHRQANLEKSLLSRLFNKVVALVTRVGLHDFNCSFKAYRQEVLQEIEVYGELIGRYFRTRWVSLVI